VQLLQEQLASIGHFHAAHSVIDFLLYLLIVLTFHPLITPDWRLSWWAPIALTTIFKRVWVAQVTPAVRAVVLVADKAALAAYVDLKCIRG